uniref:Uncharacterized protein n=1 Tax=Parastrongyloides trichosuri TaxID=131310 RepID=A0A0N4Z7J2_PARTI
MTIEKLLFLLFLIYSALNYNVLGQYGSVRLLECDRVDQNATKGTEICTYYQNACFVHHLKQGNDSYAVDAGCTRIRDINKVKQGEARGVRECPKGTDGPRHSCSFFYPPPGTNCCCQSNLCNEFTRISKDAMNLSIKLLNVNILRPSNANIPRQLGSNIRRPSNANIPRMSGSNIRRPLNANIPRLSGSNIRRPSISEVSRLSSLQCHERPRRSCSFLNPIPGTNCCCQSNLCNEFTRISKDATNLSIGPSNVNIPRPPSANIPGPSGVYIPGPSGVNIPRPPSANIPGPSGVYIPGPSGVNIPGPSGVNIPGPSGVNIPGPSGVRISRPLGVRAPRPLGVRAPRPSGVRAPRPSGVRAPKPSLVGISRPSSVNIPQISGANIPQPHSLQCHDVSYKFIN